MGPVRAGLGLPEDLSPLRGCALSPSCCSLGLLLLLRGVTRSKNLWVLCSTSARCFACQESSKLLGHVPSETRQGIDAALGRSRRLSPGARSARPEHCL